MIHNINTFPISIQIELIKNFILGLFVYYTVFRITNVTLNNKKYIITSLLSMFFISIIVTYIKYKVNESISILFFIFLISLIYTKLTNNKIGYILLVTVISYGVNRILFFLGIIIAFLINIIIVISNDYINLFIMIVFHAILLYLIGKIKKIKNGISYLNNNYLNSFLDIVILNISTIISFSVIIFYNADGNANLTRSLFGAFILFSIIMFITIKKSIEAYYKQKLLIQDLNETKKELEEKKKEVEELEAENLSFSKKSHSLAHKQKSLEFKINKLLMNSENAEELGLQEELKNIANQLQENSKLPKLDKTGITEIDDMLDVMQEECRLNRIDFNLQLNGNIYHMTNNYVTKEELAILLADHIKDAIIAINHTDNINKSIMVRLGKIDDCFGLYIYDSGVEFSKEIFEKLGKEPITSYANEGGTGMGFMNTFDTLKKHNASLIIESIGKPCKDNYTKVIRIRFDNKREVLFV